MRIQELLEYVDKYKGMKNVKGTVYLLHLDRPLAHSQHYIGWTTDMEGRQEKHQAGQGSAFLRAAKENGINFKVVRTWENEDRNFERKLKNRKKARVFCPICQEKVKADKAIKESFNCFLLETQRSAVYKSTVPAVYKDLPKLGHGLTSLVLDKGDGNVIMFTRDAVKAEWLTRDWGIKIGETVDVLHGMPHKKMEIRDMPVYVIQMPKLYKLDSKNRAIIKKEVDNWHRVRMNSSGVNAEDRFHNELTNFIDAYPDSVLVPMIEFLSNYGTMANVDVAVRNTLQDKDGNIILVDPIVSAELLKIMYGR